jgi:hypothetical protein
MSLSRGTLEVVMLSRYTYTLLLSMIWCAVRYGGIPGIHHGLNPTLSFRFNEPLSSS